MRSSITGQQLPTAHWKFKEHCSLSRNFISDFPVKSFSLLHFMQNATGPADLATMATGGTATQVNSALFGGVKLATTKTIGLSIPVPMDMDHAKAFEFRWCGSSTGASGTVTFASVYGTAKLASTAVAVAATAPGTDTSAITLGLANRLEATGWGQVTGAAMTALSLTGGDDRVILKGTVTIVTASDFTIDYVQYGYYRKSLN